MRHRQVRQVLLEGDAFAPAGLHHVDHRLDLALDVVSGGLIGREVLRRVDQRAAFGCETRFRRVDREVQRRVDAERDDALRPGQRCQRDLETRVANRRRQLRRKSRDRRQCVHVCRSGGDDDRGRADDRSVGEPNAVDLMRRPSFERDSPRLWSELRARVACDSRQSVDDGLPAAVEIQHVRPQAQLQLLDRPAGALPPWIVGECRHAAQHLDDVRRPFVADRPQPFVEGPCVPLPRVD